LSSDEWHTIDEYSATDHLIGIDNIEHSSLTLRKVINFFGDLLCEEVVLIIDK
jgi:hypothetical protein